MNSTFVVCTKNDEYPASLEVRKLYPQLPDSDAERHGQVRIIDESGEDYLYPQEYFRPIQLPAEIIEAISNSA